MEKQQSRRHLVLVPVPFPGHVNPMLALAAALHSKGFSNITVAHSQFNFPDQSNHPQFTFLKMSDGLSREDLSQGFAASIRIINEKFKTPLHEFLSRMIQESGERPCLIYDGFMYLTEAVARALKLPSLVMRTSSATDFLMYFSLPSLQQEGLIPLPDSKLPDDLVPGLEPLRFKDLPAIRSASNLVSLLQLLTSTCNLRSSSALIFNTIDLLENSSLTKVQQLCQVPVFALGPMHKIAPTSSSSGLIKPDVSCIDWLDKQAPNSILYISMGSGVSMNKKDLTEMAWGLANSGQPFLWVIRPSSIEGSEWIELLPEGFEESVGERGRIVKWAPQVEVLAHEAVGGFWSHCGWNSTLESLSEGVPMICRPSYGDQMINSRLLTYVWKVGFEVENELERGEIDRCINRVMVDEEGKEMRQRAMDLKKNIGLSMEKGGSSYDSLNDLVKLIESF